LIKHRLRTATLLVFAALMSILWVSPSAADVVDTADRCQNCVFGPVTMSRAPGEPVPRVVFPSFPGRDYQLVIRSWTTRGRSRIRLNGALVVRSTGKTTAPPPPISVRLQDSNELVADIAPHSKLTIEIRAPFDQRLPSCGLFDSASGPEPLFEQPITPLADLDYIIPLGHMEPTALHTLPTHHVYPTPRMFGGRFLTLDIRAPARARIVSIGRDPATGDIDISLRPCDEVRLYIMHVRALSPRLAARLGLPRFWDPIPAAYSSSATFPVSVARTAIDVAPGELLGRFPPGPGGINYAIGVIDRRRPDLPFVNPGRFAPPFELLDELGITLEDALWLLDDYAPDRLRQHCPLDYYQPGLRVLHEVKLGLDHPRTVPPLCGHHMRDVAGTAQGNWFEPDVYSSVVDESNLFAFAPSVFDDKPAFSFGMRGASTSSSPALALTILFYYPTGLPGSTVNVSPGDVTPGPAVYCFDGLHYRGPPDQPVSAVLFVQMPDVDTLWVRAALGVSSCSSVPRPPDLAAVGGVKYVR
jgi:hypothetical protein